MDQIRGWTVKDTGCSVAGETATESEPLGELGDAAETRPSFNDRAARDFRGLPVYFGREKARGGRP